MLRAFLILSLLHWFLLVVVGAGKLIPQGQESTQDT